MKIHTEFEQGSTAWLNARAGLVTASEVDAILTPLWKPRESKGVLTYQAQKLAERWLGTSLPDKDLFFSEPMEFGVILEKEARSAFTFITGLEVRQVGLVTDDANMVGASPDGLIGESAGIEIKCPTIEKHIAYLLAGVVPPDYLPQIHFSMYVTGFDKWYFMSFRRGLPPLIVVVHRDEKIIASIETAVGSFLAGLKAAWDRLIALNGGELPPRWKSVDDALSEPFDVIP